jgi:hypothetical protein
MKWHHVTELKVYAMRCTKKSPLRLEQKPEQHLHSQVQDATLIASDAEVAMSALFVLLVLIVLSIHIGIVLSRSLMGLLFVALDAASIREPALSPSARPVAARAATKTGVVRIAA